MKSVYNCNDLKIFNRIKTIRLHVLTNERFKADNSRYMRGRYMYYVPCLRTCIHVFIFTIRHINRNISNGPLVIYFSIA